MKKYDLELMQWKWDVDAFDRWKAFYELNISNEAKEKALNHLKKLQSRHPYHKLGDLPG